MGALHPVENVEIHWIFESRHQICLDFALVFVRFLVINLGDCLHDHEIVFAPELAEIQKNRVCNLGGVDSENHAVIHRKWVVIKPFRVVVLAVSHHAVDDAMGWILTSVKNDFIKFVTYGTKKKLVVFLIEISRKNVLFLVSDVWKSKTLNLFFACYAEASVDVGCRSEFAVIVDGDVNKRQLLLCDAVHNAAVHAENLSICSYFNKNNDNE